ncbi:hypothetical protein Glove_624g4 [Diversispora epigaea]|uniref:Uncharacterized protein n=1 Tax=Diversispora epigaea TaxID=1348612 RepID=A0A397G8K4_9GLOM|nr:hypothetical protein Glove_624g4 [Diversispora epigaea]
MKRFSEVARMKRIKFINAKLINKTSSGIWHPIPVTCEEADCNSGRLRFCSLSSKSCDNLINILQEIRNILNESSINMDKEE